MSRKIKSLTYQIQHVFDSKLAIGNSKHEDKKNGTTADKIYSWDTYRSYMKHCNYFTDYCKEKHNCRTLEECRPYVNEWLETRFNLSAYTVKLEAASLAKLYGCSTTEFVKTPQRNRDNITRSRGVAKRDKYFSEKNHQDLVDLCRALGPRRHELAKMKGTDLIEKGGKYFVGIFGKGGKYREAPIIGTNTEKVVQLFKNAGPNKLFEKVPSGADIHGYRSEYATAIYKANARPKHICEKEKFYNKEHSNGTGKPKGGYDKDSVYRMRGSHQGEWLDKKAMLITSEALGHNRISVVGEHYIR